MSVMNTRYAVAFDTQFFDGYLENFFGYILGEEWATIEGTETDLFPANTFIKIGHGGGFRNAAIENTFEAIEASRALGLKAFELDIFHDNTKLICAHNAGIGHQMNCIDDICSNVSEVR